MAACEVALPIRTAVYGINQGRRREYIYITEVRCRNLFHPLSTLQEKRLLQKYFDEINQDTGKYCFMVDDTLKGLDLGAVETLIVWDNLDINRSGLYRCRGLYLYSNTLRSFVGTLCFGVFPVWV